MTRGSIPPPRGHDPSPHPESAASATLLPVTSLESFIFSLLILKFCFYSGYKSLRKQEVCRGLLTLRVIFSYPHGALETQKFSILENPVCFFLCHLCRAVTELFSCVFFWALGDLSPSLLGL